MASIHETKVGTYHPAPTETVAWIINDTRGYIDAGPACDDCGACECPNRLHCDASQPHKACETCDQCHSDTPAECIGLSFAYVCLDGGDSLCEDCARSECIDIIPCDCE